MCPTHLFTCLLKDIHDICFRNFQNISDISQVEVDMLVKAYEYSSPFGSRSFKWSNGSYIILRLRSSYFWFFRASHRLKGEGIKAHDMKFHPI